MTLYLYERNTLTGPVDAILKEQNESIRVNLSGSQTMALTERCHFRPKPLLEINAFSLPCQGQDATMTASQCDLRGSMRSPPGFRRGGSG